MGIMAAARGTSAVCRNSTPAYVKVLSKSSFIELESITVYYLNEECCLHSEYGRIIHQELRTSDAQQKSHVNTCIECYYHIYPSL